VETITQRAIDREVFDLYDEYCHGAIDRREFLRRAGTLGADLRAAVPFYGAAAETAAVPRIRAPLLLHFAERDERINAMWPAYESALKAAGARYEAHVYPGTQHGFHNDSTPRYAEAAAKLAWERTLAFFRSCLS